MRDIFFDCRPLLTCVGLGLLHCITDCDARQNTKERWLSGRKRQIANLLMPLGVSEGSNPSLSVLNAATHLNTTDA
jgi:hypothetical protein